jgi:NO-binding membrane sensor protein with MHYT domain
MLPKGYDPLLVVLSYAVALLGSYTALGIAARLTAPGGQIRMPWLFGGSFAQATGIWGMHFTGMLALRLPIPVSYDVTLVALSFLIAMTGTLIALWLTHRPSLRREVLVAGGISIGAGIAGLHYLNMTAMRMRAITRYNALLVIASIIIAIIFGFLGLWIARRYQREDPQRSRIRKALAAAIMAIAIFGMHYTGMAAASFYGAPQAQYSSNGLALPATDLPQTVMLSTLLILATTLASVGIDRRSSARALVARRLLAAQEGERRRIARVLHDDVGQLLTAVRLNLQNQTPPGRGEATVIGESIGLVDEALTRVRALSVELRPSVLDDLGLGDAVAWFANRQAERAGYAVVVEQTLGDRRLPEAIETAGFRLIQQALTNIARHSKAKHVRILLRRGEREVELTVTDDGIGFDVRNAQIRAHAGESLGLVDMTELANLAGGSLTINSAEGKGSMVRARFPLQPHR